MTAERTIIPFLRAGDLHISISIAGISGNNIKKAIEDIVISNLYVFYKKAAICWQFSAFGFQQKNKGGTIKSESEIANWK
jgi:hypothetical protein